MILKEHEMVKKYFINAFDGAKFALSRIKLFVIVYISFDFAQYLMI